MDNPHSSLLGWPGFHSVDLHPHVLDEWASQPGGQALGVSQRPALGPTCLSILGVTQSGEGSAKEEGGDRG